MKYSFIVIALMLTFLACSKNQEPGSSGEKGLAGKWRLTEMFMSPGSGGQWYTVPPANQCEIEFAKNGVFSYSPNFGKASAGFNRYVFTDKKVLMTSTMNNKSEEWYVHYLDGERLDISIFLCFEGCAYRFTRSR